MIINTTSLYELVQNGATRDELQNLFQENLEDAFWRKRIETNASNRDEDGERLFNNISVFINKYYPEAREIISTQNPENFTKTLDLLLPLIIEFLERLREVKNL
jgi:hypothetical protein